MSKNIFEKTLFVNILYKTLMAGSTAALVIWVVELEIAADQAGIRFVQSGAAGAEGGCGLR